MKTTAKLQSILFVLLLTAASLAQIEADIKHISSDFFPITENRFDGLEIAPEYLYGINSPLGSIVGFGFVEWRYFNELSYITEHSTAYRLPFGSPIEQLPLPGIELELFYPGSDLGTKVGLVFNAKLPLFRYFGVTYFGWTNSNVPFDESYKIVWNSKPFMIGDFAINTEGFFRVRPDFVNYGQPQIWLAKGESNVKFGVELELTDRDVFPLFGFRYTL